MADHSALDRMIARLRALPTMVDRAAPEVAKAVEQELVAQIARGEAPDGQSWQPTKDGRTPLRGAARGLTVRAIGTVVLAKLEGIHARHHLGAVKGKVKRRILPSGKIPGPVSKAIEKVVTGEFRKTMGVTR